MEARAGFQKGNLEGQVKSVGELMISFLRAEVSSFIYDTCHPCALSKRAGLTAGA